MFRSLFEHADQARTFELLADGLGACCCNAERLVSDARVLAEAGRLSSARFLLTTAREEIGKSFILTDCCRLDFMKHDSVLRKLCRAFYDHISKHAYLKLIEFPEVGSMQDAQTIWETEVRRFWPGNLESGEPDMPHDTCFDRELPLYADYDEFDHRWLVPCDADHNIYFRLMLGVTPVDKTDKLIDSWRRASFVGICSPKVLSLLNAAFKKHYIGLDSTWDDLTRLYAKLAEQVNAQTGILPDVFRVSPISKWPLYHLVCEHSRVEG